MPTTFGGYTQQPILAELNGDGNLDLILAPVGESGASVYVGNGKGEFSLQTTLRGPAETSNGFNVVADVNGSGIPSILILGSDTVGVYLGESGTTFASPFYIGTGPSPTNILIENLHGQSPKTGLPDIVAPDGSGGVMVLLNLTTK